VGAAIVERLRPCGGDWVSRRRGDRVTVPPTEGQRDVRFGTSDAATEPLSAGYRWQAPHDA
jgi:hypothetical protein